MNRHLKALLIVGGIALLILAGVATYQKRSGTPDLAQNSAQRAVQINQDFPEFEVTDLAGRALKLSQFKGKVVIVNFWASWCGPCVEEVPSLLALLKAFPQDLVLLAISGDSNQEDIDSFMKSFPEMKTLPNSYVIWDQDKKLVQQFKVVRLPESFLLNKELKLAKKIAGSIDWHTPDALEYMKTLTNPESTPGQ